MSPQQEVWLLETLILVMMFSPLLFLVWAWIRWASPDHSSDVTPWRKGLGLTSLITVTIQLLGSLFALLVISSTRAYPYNARDWTSYTRVMLLCSVVIILLSLIGSPRARIQVILFAIANGLACLAWVVMPH